LTEDRVVGVDVGEERCIGKRVRQPSRQCQIVVRSKFALDVGFNAANASPTAIDLGVLKLNAAQQTADVREVSVVVIKTDHFGAQLLTMIAHTRLVVGTALRSSSGGLTRRNRRKPFIHACEQTKITNKLIIQARTRQNYLLYKHVAAAAEIVGRAALDHFGSHARRQGPLRPGNRIDRVNRRGIATVEIRGGCLLRLGVRLIGRSHGHRVAAHEVKGRFCMVSPDRVIVEPKAIFEAVMQGPSGGRPGDDGLDSLRNEGALVRANQQGVAAPDLGQVAVAAKAVEQGSGGRAFLAQNVDKIGA